MASYSGKRQRTTQGGRRRRKYQKVGHRYGMQRGAYAFAPPSKYVVSGRTRQSGFYGRYGGGASESKFVDTFIDGLLDASGEVAPGGGSNTPLMVIPEGTGESERVGRKVTLTSIYMRGVLSLATDTSSAMYNLVVLLDTQANGAVPSYADVFADNRSTAHLQLANSNRFVILKRWVGALTNQTVLTGPSFGAAKRVFKYYKKCNIPLEFSGTNGTITEIKSNAIYLMWESDTDDKLTYKADFRLRYSDK